MAILLTHGGGLRRFMAVISALALHVGAEAQTPPPEPGGLALGLARMTSLPSAIMMHGCCVVGNRIYVLGGNTSLGWSGAVLSADIMPNARLGAWRDERAMPDLRAYIGQSVEVVNNRIYVIGGSNFKSPSSTDDQFERAQDVLWTTVNADGTLSEWKRSTPLAQVGVSLAASCSSEIGLFVTGGKAGQNASNSITSDAVYHAPFGPDGAPGQWRQTGRMPRALFYHGASLQEDRLYVWGGAPAEGLTAVNDNVYGTTVNRDGSLGPWQIEGKMPKGTYSSCYGGMNDHLIGIAGRYSDGWPTGSIFYAPLRQKRLAQWTSLRSDIDTRIYMAMGLDRARGNVYVTGGKFRPGINLDEGNTVSTVAAFHIDPPADLKLAPAAVAGSAAPAAGAAGGFLRIEQALAQSRSTGKNTLVVFYSPQVPGSKRVWENVFKAPEFAAMAKDYVLAAIDVSGPDSRFMYTYSIFKVPAMAVLGPDGRVVRQSTRVQTLPEVQALLQAP